MFAKAEFLPQPLLDLLHSVLVVLQSLLEVVGHLLAESRVGLDSVGEDYCRSLGGGISTAVLELLPVLERRDVEVQLGLVLQKRHLRRFQSCHVVGDVGGLGPDTDTREGFALSAAGAGGLVAGLAAPAGSRLADLALVTWELSAAPATGALLRLVVTDFTLAGTLCWGFVTVRTTLTWEFSAHSAWTLTFQLGFLTPRAALTVRLGLETEITALTGVVSEVADPAAATVSEVKLAGGTLADALFFTAGWTAPAVRLREIAARTARTLILRS